MRNYFSVGEVSKITGLTINALRHYDKIGLVTPVKVDKVSKYRYYSESQLFLFDIIKFAKNINMPLEQLKEVLDQQDMNSFEEFLISIRTDMDKQIEKLTKNIQDLGEIQAQFSAAEILTQTEGLYRRDIDERMIVTSSVLSKKVYNYYVKQLSHLEQQIQENGLTPTFESGTIYSYDNGFHPIAIYRTVLVDFNLDTEIIQTLPAGNYLCINYTPEKKEEAYAIIAAQMEELGLSQAAVIDTALLNDIYHTENSCHELQVYLE